MSDRRWRCNVPPEHCDGSFTQTNKKLGEGYVKTHETSQLARKCYISYMKRVLGYKQFVGGATAHNELVDPKTGQRLIVTRASRFGTPLRKGKAGRRMNKRTSGSIS